MVYGKQNKKILNNYLSVEGIDGSGKSTKAEIIKDFFTDLGYNVLLTKEPGCPLYKGCKDLRGILLDSNIPKTINQELGLMMLDRKLHLDKIILPFLDIHILNSINSHANLLCFKDQIRLSLSIDHIIIKDINRHDLKQELNSFPSSSFSELEENPNNIVLSDRDWSSSIAYQGYGGFKKLSGKEFENYNKYILELRDIATQGFIPGLKIIFDIPVELIKTRVTNPNYFENKQIRDPQFFNRVSLGYKTQVEDNNFKYGNIVSISSLPDLKEVALETINEIIDYGIVNIPNFDERIDNFDLGNWLSNYDFNQYERKSENK